MALQRAQKELETQGRDALRRAEERSKKFGEESERMSAIAREARTLAEQQVEDASEIGSIARQAYETSNEAYNMAREALEQQHQTGNQIRVLEAQVTEIGQKLITVNSLATQTLRDSTDAYNQALRIYQQAYSLEVPEVDHETLEDQAVKVTRDARRNQEDAQRLMAENEVKDKLVLGHEQKCLQHCCTHTGPSPRNSERESRASGPSFEGPSTAAASRLAACRHGRVQGEGQGGRRDGQQRAQGRRDHPRDLERSRRVVPGTHETGSHSTFCSPPQVSRTASQRTRRLPALPWSRLPLFKR